MAGSRKSVAQIRAEQSERKHEAFHEFYLELSEVKSLREVRDIQSRRPPPSSPGREYYSNLDFFMSQFQAPFGASAGELKEYKRLIACFDKEGVLKEGSRARIEEALSKAIEQRPF